MTAAGASERDGRWAYFGGQVLSGQTMKYATEMVIFRAIAGSLIGDLLWLMTIGFVFAIVTGVVH